MRNQMERKVAATNYIPEIIARIIYLKSRIFIQAGGVHVKGRWWT